MSGDRNQIWLACYDAFLEGDAERLTELCSEDVRIASRLGAVEGREYVGHDGVREWIEDFRGRMGAFTVEPAGPPAMVTKGDRTLGTGAWHLRGAGSGIRIHDRWYMVVDWKGDVVWRVHAFGTPEEAADLAGFDLPQAED